MADAFLQIVLENLSSLIQREIGLIMGVDDEMKKLASTLATIQAVMEDAEEKQVESKPIRNWLCKLSDLTYEIDDILDECATEVSILEHKRSKLSHYNPKKILYKLNIGRRIKQVSQQLDAVAAEREKFHLRELVAPTERQTGAVRETSSFLNESDHPIYGRDEERDKIVDILVNQVRDRQELSVLPIIGIGGLGKTTLAQLVYNDPRVSDHFKTKLWVCVSDNFDVKTLVKAMVETACRDGSASHLAQLDSLEHHLFGLLNQKRYLLVLDDVWNDDQEKWGALKNVIACGSNGASVIVTTRLKKVADIMGTVPAHRLKGLPEEQCWFLMKQRAFGNEKEEHPNLENIGNRIVKKCAGVPLAAKAIGGILRFKRNEREWVRVEECEIWNLPHDSLILPALRLSYHNLPLELRQCFAYCAAFPKDTCIRRKEIIFHWMAQGYISSFRGAEAEEVGEEIWNELVQRSLFEDVNILGNDDATFKVHDLIHDLAQSIMENIIPGTPTESNNRSPSSYNRIRYVNLDWNYAAFPTILYWKMDISSVPLDFKRLRTLDASNPSMLVLPSKIGPRDFKRLRPSDTRNTWIQELPSKVGELKHLRNLNLSYTSIHTVPDAVCRLWNLQVLNLNGCSNLRVLPKKMRSMINLRHLFLEDCNSLTAMPCKIGELTSLRTLSVFMVGNEKGRGLDELQTLKLGGTFEIRHLERVKNHRDAKKVNLENKHSLYDLTFKWEEKGFTRSTTDEDMDEKVLEALEPHSNVRNLCIWGFRGRQSPVWMQNSTTLPNITRINIEECPNISCLPQALAELPRLERLILRDLKMLEYIIKDEAPRGNGNTTISLAQFPSLTYLGLDTLPKLKAFAQKKNSLVEVEMFPNLVEISISGCVTSLLLPPVLPSLSQLRTINCSSLTLSSSSKFDNLTALGISMDENVEGGGCIPKETLKNLTKLQRLLIHNAEEHSLPIEGLIGLRSVVQFGICDSKAMTCFPEEWLRQLTVVEELQIRRCLELVDVGEGIKDLRNLKRLYLVNLPKMVSLPESLQHVHSLEQLDLMELPLLTSLPDWLGNFTSLYILNIRDCPKLASLPSCIQRMPNLKGLSISGCPQLRRRCDREKGEDWHKISHISHLIIM